MGEVEIDLLKKLLSLNPNGREDAEQFLNHKYFDSIRNIIEIEMQDLTEVNTQEYKLFKENKVMSKGEIEIIEDTKEFREQEQLNNSFKREKQEIQHSNQEDSEYESSEAEDRIDFEEEANMKTSENVDEEDYEKQNLIIENFFERSQKKSYPNIPLEIEGGISESSSEIKEQLSLTPPSTQKKSSKFESTSKENGLKNIKNLNTYNRGGMTKNDQNIQLLLQSKTPLKQTRFDEGIRSTQTKNYINRSKITGKNKDTSIPSENPYSDSKRKTTYL